MNDIEKSRIKEEVLKMYLSYPCPHFTKERRHERFAAELLRFRFLGFEPHMKGARMLDVGCGTGDRSILPAKHFGVAELVGFDQSDASLAAAREAAEEEGLERFVTAKGDLFNLPFEDESFDIVVSWGVLHHTSDPLRGFREMVRVCRPGGFLGIFLYNKYAHWRHNYQKDRVNRLAGDDLEERFAVAHRLYGTKPADEMSAEEVATFYDQYCHPHKSDHTLGETIDWFDSHGLEYWGSFPPLRFLDAISALQYRAELGDEYPVESREARLFMRGAALLPRLRAGGHFRRPNVFHRAAWQSIYAWMGRNGLYSIGSALSARKRG